MDVLIHLNLARRCCWGLALIPFLVGWGVYNTTLIYGLCWVGVSLFNGWVGRLLGDVQHVQNEVEGRLVWVIRIWFAMQLAGVEVVVETK